MIRIPSSSRGFMLLDAMAGLTIVGIIATAMAFAVNSEQRAEQRLADSRAANRLADRTLLTLQRSQPTPVLPHTKIMLHAAAGDAPPGFKWVTVEASVNGRMAALSGIVPTIEGAK